MKIEPEGLTSGHRETRPLETLEGLTSGHRETRPLETLEVKAN